MKTFSLIGFISLLLLSCIQLRGLTQPQDIISRTYTMKEGLSHDAILCLLQDSQGFIWVGTPSGLNKFDGYHFTTYLENPSDSNSLTNGWVNCLWEDKQQRLWIGTTKGLDLLDLKTEKFYHLVLDTLDSVKEFNMGVHGGVNKIREREDGKLWICTGQGVYLADPQTLSVKRIIYFPQEADGNTFTDIAEARDGSLWIANRKGLFHRDAHTGQTTRYRHDPSDSHSLAHDVVSTVYIDRYDRVWAGTEKGFDLFNPEDQSFTHFLQRELQFVGSQLEVHALLEYPDGTFWVGSTRGLFAFDPETEKFDSIMDRYIWSFLKDRQGNIWVGTDYGLHQIAPQSKKFNIYRQFGQTDVADVRVYAEDVDHHLWIAGLRPNHYLFRFDPSSRRFFQFLHDPENPQSYSGNSIRGIIPDHEGGVWLASYFKLEKFDPQYQTFSSIALPFEPTTILKDSQGKIWLGGWAEAGIYDPQTETYERLPAFPRTTVNSFLEDREENIWAGTDVGLIRYSLKTGQLDIFKHDPADPQSLSNNRVYHLMMDQDGIIWMGTFGGLHQMIPGTEKAKPRFIHWRSFNSDLPSDNVYSVIDGGDGTLWMSCGNRISHFFPQTGQFRNYDYDDGLHGQSVFKGLRSHNGEMFFSSKDGLIVFHPDSLQDNPYIPPVAITGFSINSQPVPVRGSYVDTLQWETPLAHTMPYTNEIELSYQQNDFSLEFAALNFVNPGNNLYKYKLEPYEKDWIETTAGTRIARYTNISPGTYTFRVIGSNNDGLWNEEGSSLSIIIHPPWWQTWWAYTIYALLGISILFGLVYYLVSRERLKNDLKLQRLEAEKMHEIDQMKSRFFANISHEFRTPLTLILGPLKALQEGTLTGDPKAVFAVMSRNAQRLLRLINQLLDFSKLEAGKMQLQTTQTDLVLLLRHIVSAYESLATEKKIKYFFYAEVEELIMQLDQEKVATIIHNLLSNAFKFTPAGGEIILHLKVEEPWATITVKDTGIGIPAEELDKVFDRFYQVDSSQTREQEGSGLGMALAKELTELHQGQIRVESQQAKGSTFTLWLPLGKASLHPEQIRETAEVKTSEGYFVDQPLTREIAATEEETTTIEANDHPLILVVEDHADMRHYIRSILQSHYQVQEAANGVIGLQMSREGLPDLIISDVMMPQMDGYQLCEKIKTNELTSHIPIILLTAKADRQSKLTGLETGADDYLAKPFEAEELLVRIYNLIESRKKLRAHYSRQITLQPKAISITSVDEQFLQKVMLVIEAHMDDTAFGVEALGREVGMSRMQLLRKLKALTDQPPIDFIRVRRLHRAAELLRQGAGNIAEVAFQTGFQDPSYFTKCFQKQFNQTPSEFLAARTFSS